jgi:hypothetical protein
MAAGDALDRVAQRLARGGGKRLAAGIERPVADRRRLDVDRLLVLDLGNDVAQSRDERVADKLRLARHPGAQRLLPAAREACHRGRVVRLALDERERLQDRVVQLRGEALATIVRRTPPSIRSDADPLAGSVVRRRSTSIAPSPLR